MSTLLKSLIKPVPATLVLALTVAVLLLPSRKNQPPGTKAELAQKEWLAQVEHLSPEALEALPKQDRPDLAMAQELERTKDPALGYVPQGARMAAYQAVKRHLNRRAHLNLDQSVAWTERGPNNVGGRTRALMWDPNTSGKLWAGGVGGGIWYNNAIASDAETWVAVNDFMGNLAVTTLAYDPTNTQTFYAGTGEGFFNADAIRGEGLWKSTDGGSTWNQLAATSGWQYVTDVVVTDQGTIIAATRSGLYRSTDGGSSFSTIANNRYADLEIASDGTIYVCVGIFSTGSLWKSTDDGENWTNISPESGTGQRLKVASAPSNPSVLYVVASSGSNVAWLYKSTDAGSTWTGLTIPEYSEQSCSFQGRDFTRSQAWYNLLLKVLPTDENTVFLGGIDMYRSTNGGTSFDLVSYWTGSCDDYVHADQHIAAFNPNDSSQLVVGNDGGVFYLADATVGNPDWHARNNGYNVTQFYAADQTNASTSNYMLAGAQDNGTQQFNTAGINSTSEATGGDGAYCHIDQQDSNYQLTAYVYNYIYRSTNGGSSFSQISADSRGNFINYSAYDDNAKILYAAANTDEYTQISGVDQPSVTITYVSADFAGYQLSAITPSPYTDHLLFVGTERGAIYKVENANTASPTVTYLGLPAGSGTLSGISIGDSDDQLLITYSNYSTTSVYETEDGGNNWSDKEGDLPDMPVRDVLYNPYNTNQAILATEQGVWSCADLSAGSPTWVETNTGLAHVRCDQLNLRESDGQVIVATHGRGVYTGFPFEQEVSPYLHVRASATGTNKGTSWENAYTSLATALAAASNGDTVVVAAGTYYPGDTTTGFVLTDGVVLLGGWAGSETTFDQSTLDARDLSTNQAILNGTNGSSTAYHVLTIDLGASSSTVLDGFTLTGGVADGTGGAARGGGIYNDNGAPQLKNLTISGNSASHSGGGIFNGVGSNPSLNSVRLTGNSANYGAGMYNYRNTVSLTSLAATGNTATTNGGGMYNDQATATLRNVSLVSNTAEFGGAMYNKFGSHNSENLLVYSNTSNDARTNGRDIHYVGAANATIAYSLIQNSGGSSSWDSYFGTDNGNNLDADPMLVGSSADTLYDRSPAIGAGNGADGSNIGNYQGSGVALFSGALYVDASATGNNDGQSWADAYTSLTDALAIAVTTDVIYVATGTYSPSSTGDRNASFTIPSGVSLYGGLAGTEDPIDQALLDARDFATNTTTLSGDLNNDDGAGFTNRTDNSYHVVHTTGGTDVVLDGFTITGGQADGDSWDRRGGGVLLENTTATLNNLTVTDCYAEQYGAGIMNASSGTLTLTNTVIYSTQAGSTGPGFTNWEATATLTGVAITNNTADFFGGGVFNNAGTLNLRNTTLANNTSGSWRGTVYNQRGTMDLVNVVVWGNTISKSDPTRHVYNQEGLGTTISHSLIEGSGGSSSWRTGFGTDGGNNLDEDPLLADAANNDISLQIGSPALSSGNVTYGSNMGSYQGEGVAGRFSNSQDWAQQFTLRLYPNPATTQASLYKPGTGSDEVQLTVLDATGRSIVSQPIRFAEDRATLDISSWQPGHYAIILVGTDGTVYTQRLIKL